MEEIEEIFRGKTGVVYDERMAKHRCLWDPNYPECPERLLHALKRCEELELLNRCEKLEPRRATDEEILRAHSRCHLDLLHCTEGETESEKLETLSSHYDSIYIHPNTNETALLAAGSSIVLVDEVVSGQVQNGMAIIRPPGHHATKSEFCGYSFLNNVAIATHHALKKYNLSRILIVDWDIHHGQGTQRMFYEDPRVLYFSIHRYEHGDFWPHLRESEYTYIGQGKGQGYNFNLPLNQTGMKNNDYLAVFHQILLPVAYEYSPELIIVSAGYDSALGDEKGEMEITPAFYAHMTSHLMSLAKGKVAVILEGGYCLDATAEGIAMTLKTLLGDPCPSLMEALEKPCQSMVESILNLIYVQRPFWSCLQYQRTFSIDDKTESLKHIPSVKFIGREPKPMIYETRNCYPLQTDTVQESVSKLKLLEEFTLAQCNPKYKLCIASNDGGIVTKDPLRNSQEPKALWDYVKQHDTIETTNLLKVIHSVCSSESRGGLSMNDQVEDRQYFHDVINAVQLTADKYGIKKIMILDWEMCQDKRMLDSPASDLSILYMCFKSNNVTKSSGIIVDCTKASGSCEEDSGTNAGLNISIPLNENGFGDAEYISSMLQIILPISYEFNPQLILLTSKFSAFPISPICFGHIIHLMTSLANGKVVLAINNNKHLDNMSDYLIMATRALLGASLPPLEKGLIPKKEAIQVISSLVTAYSKYWPSLCFQAALPLEDVLNLDSDNGLPLLQE